MKHALCNVLVDLISALMKTLIVIAIAVPTITVTESAWKLLTDSLDVHDPNEKIICSG